MKDLFGAKEMKRINVIENFANGIISGAEAAEALGISYRQVLRLKKDLLKFGPEGLRHGNKGRSPMNKIKRTDHDLIIKTYMDWKYKTDLGVNASHLADILKRDQDLKVSRQTTWRTLKKNGLYVNVRSIKKYRKSRDRREHMGDILYLDGSPHRWYGDAHPKSTLILCTDDATTSVLSGVFTKEENRNSCFEVVYNVFTKFGLPSSFWLDRASQFITTRGEGNRYKQSELATHWQNAMYNLGVRNIFAHSPQARGRGERVNGTFQNRLCAELQYRKISTDEEATKFLNEIFIPEYNERFSVPPKNPIGLWRRPPEGYDLRNILSARYDRRVLNDNTVKHDGQTFQLERTPSGGAYAGRTVEVQMWYDSSIHIVTKNFQEINYTEIKTKPRYKTVEGLKIGKIQSDIYRQTYF